MTPIQAGRQRRIHQFLRKELHILKDFGERSAAALEGRQNQQGGNNTVPRRMMVQRYNMPGTFAAQRPVAFAQFFEHITVADAARSNSRPSAFSAISTARLVIHVPTTPAI